MKNVFKQFRAGVIKLVSRLDPQRELNEILIQSMEETKKERDEFLAENEQKWNETTIKLLKK